MKENEKSIGIKQEETNIINRYQKRINNEIYEIIGKKMFFIFYSLAEKELIFSKIIKNKFSSVKNLNIIEIGAGTGGNLLFFKKIGFKWENIFANELLTERVVLLKENLPASIIHSGNALDLNYSEYFNVVYQSTVFTSILNYDIKKLLADKMFAMTKPGGIVLWYDFKYNNPSNKDVKGVGKSEIKNLFPIAKKIDFFPVTLAPPIGRRTGRLYPIINFFFPFLRTHLIAVIHK